MCCCWAATAAISRIRIGRKRDSWGVWPPLQEDAGESGGQDCTRQRRRLGLLERWYVAHSRAGNHMGFCLCLELQAATAVPSEEELRTCLDLVSRSFPWLRVVVRRDGVQGIDSCVRLTQDSGVSEQSATPVKNSEESFASPQEKAIWGDDLYVEERLPELRSYCTRTVVLDGPYHSPAQKADGHCSDLHHILQEQSVQKWHDEDPTEALWRVTLVKWKDSPKQFALVLSFHHLITDAMGALQVARRIVQFGGGGETNPAKDEIHFKVDSKLPPPLENMLDTRISLMHLLCPLLFSRFPKLMAWIIPTSWNGNSIDSKTVTKTKRVTHSRCFPLLDASELEALHEYSSRHDLKPNSVLVATLCKCLTRFKNKKVSRNKSIGVRLSILVAADERRRRARSIRYDDLGSFVTGPTLSLTVKSDDRIERVGQVFAKQLRRAIQTSPMDIGLCAFIRQDWMDYSRKQCHQSPNGALRSLAISLLTGTTNDWRCGKAWTVSNFWFAQGQRGFGPVLRVNVNDTCNGLNEKSFPRMNWKSLRRNGSMN